MILQCYWWCFSDTSVVESLQLWGAVNQNCGCIQKFFIWHSPEVSKCGLCLGKELRGSSNIGILRAYSLKRAMPGLSGELLITFLLQQAPKHSLEGGSSKVPAQQGTGRQCSQLLLHVRQRGSMKSDHLVYRGDLEVTLCGLCVEEVQFKHMLGLREGSRMQQFRMSGSVPLCRLCVHLC